MNEGIRATREERIMPRRHFLSRKRVATETGFGPQLTNCCPNRFKDDQVVQMPSILLAPAS